MIYYDFFYFDFLFCYLVLYKVVWKALMVTVICFGLIDIAG